MNKKLKMFLWVIGMILVLGLVFVMFNMSWHNFYYNTKTSLFGEVWQISGGGYDKYLCEKDNSDLLRDVPSASCSVCEPRQAQSNNGYVTIYMSDCTFNKKYCVGHVKDYWGACH